MGSSLPMQALKKSLDFSVLAFGIPAK